MALVKYLKAAPAASEKERNPFKDLFIYGLAAKYLVDIHVAEVNVQSLTMGNTEDWRTLHNYDCTWARIISHSVQHVKYYKEVNTLVNIACTLTWHELHFRVPENAENSILAALDQTISVKTIMMMLSAPIYISWRKVGN